MKVELDCHNCGKVHEVEEFQSEDCECGWYWLADETPGGTPTGEWLPPVRESKT